MRNVSSPTLAEVEGAQWMTRWSEDEELHADYSLELSAPWEGRRPLMLGGVTVVALLAFAAKLGSGKVSGTAGSGHFSEKTSMME